MTNISGKLGWLVIASCIAGCSTRVTTTEACTDDQDCGACERCDEGVCVDDPFAEGCGPAPDGPAPPDDVIRDSQVLPDAGQQPDTAAAPPVPTNRSDKCTEPVRLELHQGKVLVSGNTMGARSETDLGLDESHVIQCDPRLELYGPQHYFVVKLDAQAAYNIQLTKSKWTAAVYIFSDLSCDPQVVNRQCHYEKPEGGAYGISEGAESISLYFVPKKSSDFVIAVDSPNDGYGSYSLLIEKAI